MTGAKRWCRGPQPTLSDGIVTLRPWQDGDADDVLAACQDDEIQRWTTVPIPYRLADAEEFIRSSRQLWASGTEAPFALVNANDDSLIGSCGLVRIDTDEGVGEVGYWTAPWARRRGHLTRALTLLAAWASESTDLTNLSAAVEPENTASVRSALAAGFSMTAQGRVLPLRGEPRRYVVLTRHLRP